MLEPRLLHYVYEGDGPTLGLAVHAGHEIRPDLLRWMALDEVDRLREEDPFTESGCVLAIEVKKTFMDEWTGEVDEMHLRALRETLSVAARGVTEALKEVG